MKTAKILTAAFWADCAYCGESLETLDGGYLLYRDDYHKINDLHITCTQCGKENKLPKKLLYPQ